MTLSLRRGAEILYSLALAHARRAGADSRYPLSDYALLTNARRNLGLFQHHDAITGTAKEAVVVDYGVRCVRVAAAQPGGPAGGWWVWGWACWLGPSGMWGRCRGMLGGGRGDGPGCLTARCSRLLHSLSSLKRVIINAAHYLVLGDKDAYRYDPAAPFLSTVSSSLPRGSPRPSLVLGSPCPFPCGTAPPAHPLLAGALGELLQPPGTPLARRAGGGGDAVADLLLPLG